MSRSSEVSLFSEITVAVPFVVGFPDCAVCASLCATAAAYPLPLLLFLLLFVQKTSNMKDTNTEDTEDTDKTEDNKTNKYPDGRIQVKHSDGTKEWVDISPDIPHNISAAVAPCANLYHHKVAARFLEFCKVNLSLMKVIRQCSMATRNGCLQWLIWSG